MRGRLLKRFVRATARRLGYELVPSRTGLDAWADLVAVVGPDAGVIVDVGANVGQTADEFARLFPVARIHAFEPNPSAFAQLQHNVAGRSRITSHQLALSDSDGTETFYVTRANEGSSLLPTVDNVASLRLGSWTAADHECVVRTRRLDVLAAELQITTIDLLKTDTQGAELKVLSGAGDLLTPDRIKAVFCETLFIPVYARQSFFDEVYALLSGHGYSLVGLYNEVRDGRRRLQWADALFV